MDDVVKRVARAMAEEKDLPWDGRGSETEYANHGYWLPIAKAAIRAVLEGLEPVGWVYTSPFGREECTTRWAADEGRTSDDWIGWTETPLYDLSAIKEAVK